MFYLSIIIILFMLIVQDLHGVKLLMGY